MDRFARVVLGYHGCMEPTATKLLSGELPIGEWPRSENRWDWLGSGVYFWEHAPERARRWATEKASRDPSGAKGAVVGAVIQLGRCLDLTDVTNTERLGKAHSGVVAAYEKAGKKLPKNHGGDKDRKRRELDCLIINVCVELAAEEGELYSSVRGAFMEGDLVYRGAMVWKESHVQIAVRDPRCILGVFRPNL